MSGHEHPGGGASATGDAADLAAEFPIRLRSLVFTMGEQEYVVDVAQVREMLRPSGLLRLGGAPEYVLGLMKRRGQIVPVVDLRKRLGLTPTPFDVSTCVIVAKLEAGPIGLLVDSVVELTWIETKHLEPPSPFVVPLAREYVRAVAHLGTRLLVMLDLERIFDPDELRQLDEVRHATPRPEATGEEASHE